MSRSLLSFFLTILINLLQPSDSPVFFIYIYIYNLLLCAAKSDDSTSDLEEICKNKAAVSEYKPLMILFNIN